MSSRVKIGKLQISVHWSKKATIWDIIGFPIFMYLWHAINSSRLDRKITLSLPANKPGVFVTSPLFIMHKPLWCQGQSDRIVTVKGNDHVMQNEKYNLHAWRIFSSFGHVLN